MSDFYQFRKGSIWHKARATKTVCGTPLRGRGAERFAEEVPERARYCPRCFPPPRCSHMISALTITERREIRDGQGFFPGMTPQRSRRCKLRAVPGHTRCARHARSGGEA